MLSNRVVSMRDAMRVGLVHELVDGATACRSRARAVAAELAKKPARALLETRTWMSRVEGRMHGAIEPLLRLSHEASASLAGGEEERSLMAKALARRRES
jgi:enoyl-CoA hydratase/carnithine racemase